MIIANPEHFPDYELIDSGAQEKLERFGDHILCRPEPQALWDKKLPSKEWDSLAYATFRRVREHHQGTWEGERGEWRKKGELPERWFIRYHYRDLQLNIRLGLTAFGHIGVFPEQEVNWSFLYDSLRSISNRKTRILNLFAYTGVASLVACAAGAEVVHVDSVKPVLSWAKENMEASGLKDIRWVAEDALKFVRREHKRGNMYDAILLDPPAYGRGPEGEKWVLEDQLNEMMHLCSAILNRKEGSILLLNMYSLGQSALIARNLVQDVLSGGNITFGELAVPDRSGRPLPLGVWARAQF